MAGCLLESMIPPCVFFCILDRLPIIDLYPLKLAGNRYISEVVRNYVDLISRREYCLAITEEDKRRGNFAVNDKTRTALEITIERDQEALVRHYLKKYQALKEKGAETPIARENQEFKPALHWAAYYGSPSIAKLLLYKIDTRLYGTKRTAMHIAAMRGHSNVVELLINEGANMDLLDAFGMTPLGLALGEDHQSVVSVLQSKEAAANLDEAKRKYGAKWLYLLPGRSDIYSKRLAKIQEATIAKYRSQAIWIDKDYCKQRHLFVRMWIEYWSAMNASPRDTFSIARRRIALIAYAKTHSDPALLLKALRVMLDTDTIFDDDASTDMNLGLFSEDIEYVRTCLELRRAKRGLETRGKLTPSSATTDDSDEILNSLLKYFSIDSKVSEDKNALHIAAGKGDAAMVLTLLKRGASSEVRTDEGRTALHLAAGEAFSTECVRHLLDFGAKIEATDRDSLTPLHYAASNSHLLDHRQKSTAVIELLLKSGANLNTRDYHESTPLHDAVGMGAIKALLNFGADPNARDASGNTAILRYTGYGGLSSYSSKERCVWDILHQHGAAFNAMNDVGYSIFHSALARNEYHLSWFLWDPMRYGFDMNAPDDNLDFPLHIALKTSDAEIAKLLPLWEIDHPIFKRRFNHCTKILKAILDNGGDINGADRYGKTAAHHAMERNSRFFDLLLKYGPELNKADNFGVTPLSIAASLGNVEKASILLEKGAVVNVKDEEQATPLHYIFKDSSTQSIDMVQLLIASGADVNARNEDGYTPLDLAVELNLHAHASLLREHI